MAFDGIVLNSVVCELKNNLINAKINKIHEPTKNEIIIGFYKPPKNIALLINIHHENARIHCTTHSKPNPQQSPNFCMLLRKHLIGSRLISINTFDLERIVELVFETYNELQDKVTKKLIVEVMASHSNIILVNENNVIIDALRHVISKDVEIMPARIYESPNNSKQSFIKLSNFSSFKDLIFNNSNEPIDKILSDTFIGISRGFVQNLGVDDLEEIYNSIKNIISNIPNLSIKNTCNKKDYFVYISPQKEPLEVNFLLDDFYFAKEKENTFLQKKKQLLSLLSVQLKKYTKRLENINNKLLECQNMEQNRIYGELITANLYRFNSSVNLDNITVENYYDNQNKITIPLDKRFSLSKNAEKYFKKYNKLKNTLRIVSIQKQETNVELEYLQSLLFSIENSTCLQELEDIFLEMEETNLFGLRKQVNTKKSENKSTPLEFNIDGFTVFAGKNNKQNDFLTLKTAKKEDIWFHVQNIQGSHVILKTEGKKISNSVILKCAKIAIENSKAKNSTHVSVDYCPVKNVKKPSGSRPGMVIYQNYKTIIV